MPLWIHLRLGTASLGGCLFITSALPEVLSSINGGGEAFSKKQRRHWRHLTRQVGDKSQVRGAHTHTHTNAAELCAFEVIDTQSHILRCRIFFSQSMQFTRNLSCLLESDDKTGLLLSSRWYLYQINPGFKILFNQLLQDARLPETSHFVELKPLRAFQ